jgi:hypothetical protein
MSGISKTKIQKLRFDMAIAGDKSAIKKLLQKKPRKHEESKLQIECVKQFRQLYPQYERLFFAIPNAGTGRNKIQGGILKAEGVLSGVADTFLSVPKIPRDDFYGCLFGLYIEFKIDKGVQSPEQKEFQKAVELQGYQYTICRSVDEFITTINEYL